MLDKILSFIASAFTLKGVNATNTNSSVWTGGYIQCWKRAGIVMIRTAMTLTAVGSRVTIGTIPERYRPNSETYYNLQDDGRLILGTDGSIKVEGASGGSYYETTTYVSGGVL